MPKKHKIRGIIGLDETATPEALETFLDEANGQAVAVYFNSPGGFVFFGLEMANMIRDYPGHTVARIVGLAASMSSYVPMMFDEVVVEDNAIFMIHNPMAGASGIDYRDAQKLANRLEALAGLLGNAYAAKSGKDIAKIRSLMDDETFLYGQEIVDEGFADSIVVGKNGDKDKSSAIAVAEEQISACISSMKESEIKASDDFERAAAFLNKAVPEPPAAAGKPKEEASIMNLKELLAANPDAQAEHDDAVTVAATTARAEGETAGKKTGMEQMKTAFTTALPILSSDSYPDTVKERVTAKATAGDVEGLKDFVAMHDMNLENKAQSDADDDAADDTPPNPPDASMVGADGVVSNPDQLAGAVAQHKEQFGTGGTK